MPLRLGLAEGVDAKAETVYEVLEYALGVCLSASVDVRGEEGNAPGIELVGRSGEGGLWFE